MPVSYTDLIAKKRDGQELTDEEVGAFVSGVTSGDMADCQIGAMLMAIFHKGLSPKEISTLTRDMMTSGTTMTWPSEWAGQLVDKHSTGGVGDKISLVLAPALAACGLKVPMISGRGLGHTGGTLDKLEAIPGFKVSLTPEEMIQILSSVGCFIAGQTGDICPADKKTYAIRDVTATVKHIGLITASIVSKKAAENISALVLDVKTGSGAFMREKEEAAQLAKCMVSCSSSLGIKTVALLTDMDRPIGNMVGNALEVAESVQCLQDQGPQDLLDLVTELGGHLLFTGGHATSVEEGRANLLSKVKDGSALTKFLEMMKAQGVDATFADDLCNPKIDIWTKLTPAKSKTELLCPEDGYVQRIDALDVAVAVHKLGGGRDTPGMAVKWAVGVELSVHVGDKVQKGQPWVVVHHDDPLDEKVRGLLERALVLSSTPGQKNGSRLQNVFK